MVAAWIRELTGVGRLVSVMHDTGFEVCHEENLREHYALTTGAWSVNLDAHWAEAVAEVGSEPVILAIEAPLLEAAGGAAAPF